MTLTRDAKFPGLHPQLCPLDFALHGLDSAAAAAPAAYAALVVPIDPADGCMACRAPHAAAAAAANFGRALIPTSLGISSQAF